MTTETKLMVPEIEMKTFINASPERVFECISTAGGWDSWFTQGTELDPRPGGHLMFRWKEFGATRTKLEMKCTIVDIIPERKFIFQWSPSGSKTTVTLSVEKRGDGCIITASEKGYELNEKSLWQFMDCSTGWGEALTLLKFYIEHGITYGAVPVE